MATFGSTVRRGLPRIPGGDAWPAAGAAPVAVAEEATASFAAQGASVEQSAVAERSAAEGQGGATIESTHAGQRGSAAQGAVAAQTVGQNAVTVPVSSAPAAEARPVRRGLPRVPGGEPWPAASAVTVVAASPSTSPDPAPRPDAAPREQIAQTPDILPRPAVAADGEPLRRGLPRVPGGEPWPPAGFAPGAIAIAEPSVAPASAPVAEPVAASTTVAVPEGPRAPLPFTRTVFPGAAANARPAPAPEPRRYGPFTRVQWAGAVVVGGIGLLFAAAMLVLAVRWLLSLDGLRDFLVTYPGEYHLPEGAPVGFPAWLGWQHFLNTFFILLIIRTGLQVRREKRPTAFWSPRHDKKRKISLSLWFHQSLDILWVVNGVAFVVLLFVSGQWMRIIPTSWEVFPNALSAALHYVSLDWPTENGWVNYNALQQLAYFTTVFIAAPLAIITGVRMSGIWPKNAKTLSRIYPVEWARAVHFPVMLYFVVFIAIHVFLVFATGALRNLNHMYAMQGSTDPNAYADNWTGFWFFVASMVVIAAAWIAARPLVLAPIARLFGTVSGR